MRGVSLKNKFQAALLGVWIAQRQAIQPAANQASWAMQPSALQALGDDLWQQMEAWLSQPVRKDWPMEHRTYPMMLSPEAMLVYSVPALLMWHDNARRRDTWRLALPLSSEIQANLGLLGHVMEYLLGQADRRQGLGPQLVAYLGQQAQEDRSAGDAPVAPRLQETKAGLNFSPISAIPMVYISDISDRGLPPWPEDSAVTVALQSFLTVPESYGLAVNHALQAQGGLAAMLTGLMAGAYGGMDILPVEWLFSDALQRLGRLSDQLFAHWTGRVNLAGQSQRSPLSSQMVDAVTV